MKVSQEQVLEEAFKLFMTNNYEKVTITDLENALGISRAAIFFRIKNKSNLFRMVVDKYILSAQSTEYATDLFTWQGSFKDFLEQFITCIDNRMQYFKGLHIQNVSHAYFSLLIQAPRYYENFSEKMSLLVNDQITAITILVERAIKEGELKSSITPYNVARRIRTMYSGLSFDQSFGNGLSIHDLKFMFNTYYDEIKVK